MEANRITKAAWLHWKAAADPSLTEALQHTATRQLQAQALRDVLGYGGAAVGIGAGLRGLSELFRMGSQAIPVGKKRKALTAPSAIYAQMPVPRDDEDEKIASITSAVGDFVAGGQAQTREGIPWFTPAVVGAPLLGGLGGWKFMDWMLDKRRKGQISEEVDAAKAEYEKALAEAQGVKRSSDSELGRTLDRLYELAIEKRSGTVADMGGQALGLYLLAAGGAAGLTGYAGYNWAKKRTRREIIDKALKNLKRKQQLQQPAPIFVQPMPVARRANKPIDTSLAGPAPSLAAREDKLDQEAF